MQQFLLKKSFLFRVFIISISFTMFIGTVSAAKDPVVLYQDAKLTIYDDNPDSGFSKTLSFMHNVGLDEELFAVSIKTVKDEFGRNQDYYEYLPSVMEDFKTKLPDIYLGKFNNVTLYHFVKGHNLRPDKKSDGHPRGRYVAKIVLLNHGYPNRAVNWGFYNKGSYHASSILMNFLNTYNKVDNWRNASEQLVTQTLSSTSKSAEEFGYTAYKLLLTVGNTEYFLVKSSFQAQLKLVAVHAVGENDAVVDLDIFPIRQTSGRQSLGFYYSDKTIADFNQHLAPLLNNIVTHERQVVIYHYVKNKPLPEQPNKGSFEPSKNYPVFVSAFSPRPSSSEWEPLYSVSNKGRVTGDFSSYGTRYSYASTLAYIKEYNVNRMNSANGRDIPAKAWSEEADEAYRYASPEAKARRGKYRLWTDGYWQFYDSDVGRNLIDGLFDRIPLDHHFTNLYEGFLLNYSRFCGDQIINPKVFRHTSVRRHSSYGASWDETLGDYTISMEPRFAENYENYYYNRAIVMPEDMYSKVTYNGMVESHRFMQIEGCNSEVLVRLRENLYRRSQGMTALIDEFKPSNTVEVSLTSTSNAGERQSIDLVQTQNQFEPEKVSASKTTLASPAVDNDLAPVTLGIKLGMNIAEVRKHLAGTDYKLAWGPQDGELKTYVIKKTNGDIPTEFKLNVSAYPVIAKSSAIEERDLIVLLLYGSRDFKYRQDNNPEKKMPILSDILSFYQNTYGGIYALHKGKVEFRPGLSFTSNYSISDVEVPPLPINDQASPIVICQQALLKLQHYAAGQIPFAQQTFEDMLKRQQAHPQFAHISKQCSGMMLVNFVPVKEFWRDVQIYTVMFSYADAHRLEDVHNALAQTKRMGKSTIAFAANK